MSRMHKDKGGGPGCPAGVNEMMEPQSLGHIDGGGGDVYVSLAGGIFKKVDMD